MDKQENRERGEKEKTGSAPVSKEQAVFSSHLKVSLAASRLTWLWVCIFIYPGITGHEKSNTMAAKMFDRHRARCESCEPGSQPEHGELCHLLYPLEHFRARLPGPRSPLRALAFNRWEERRRTTQPSINLFCTAACRDTAG